MQSKLNIVIAVKGGKTPNGPDTDPPEGLRAAGDLADVVLGVNAEKDEVIVLKGKDKVNVMLFT